MADLNSFNRAFISFKVSFLFIRNSYLGGGTDYYKAKGENLYYYDVNSLYPYAMLNDMPLNIIKKYKKGSIMPELKEFFGFARAEIELPINANIINPLLPMKYNNKTIFPGPGSK